MSAVWEIFHTEVGCEETSTNHAWIKDRFSILKGAAFSVSKVLEIFYIGVNEEASEQTMYGWIKDIYMILK